MGLIKINWKSSIRHLKIWDNMFSFSVTPLFNWLLTLKTMKFRSTQRQQTETADETTKWGGAECWSQRLQNLHQEPGTRDNSTWARKTLHNITMLIWGPTRFPVFGAANAWEQLKLKQPQFCPRSVARPISWDSTPSCPNRPHPNTKDWKRDFHSHRYRWPPHLPWT